MGFTLLHFGVLSGEIEVIKYLVEKGLDLNLANDVSYVYNSYCIYICIMLIQLHIIL